MDWLLDYLVVKEQLTKIAYVLSKNVRVIIHIGLENNGKEIQRDLFEISGRNSSVRNMEIPKISVVVTFDCVPIRATTDLTRGGEAQIFHKSRHHLKILGAEGLQYIEEVPYEGSINTYLVTPCRLIARASW
jgi:hypothetical protein